MTNTLLRRQMLAAVIVAMVSSAARQAHGRDHDIQFEIGPLDGFTTVWHKAPEETAIPIGTTVRFRIRLSGQLAQAHDGVQPIRWNGVKETHREQFMSVAERRITMAGQHIVEAIVRIDNQVTRHSCRLQAVGVRWEHVKVQDVSVEWDPVALDDAATNQQTMDVYFGPSIATVVETGPSKYRTSVQRVFYANVATDPPGFEPLCEWRIEDVAVGMGRLTPLSFDEIGVHVVSAGPPGQEASMRVETYRADIVSGDLVPDGQAVTMYVQTEPPGYEDDVTWLASTKYGRGLPVMGSGDSFEVQFDETWGPDNDGNMWQWLGVRADNAALGQDQKCSCSAELGDGTQCPDEDVDVVCVITNDGPEEKTFDWEVRQTGGNAIFESNFGTVITTLGSGSVTLGPGASFDSPLDVNVDEDSPAGTGNLILEVKVNGALLCSDTGTITVCDGPEPDFFNFDVDVTFPLHDNLGHVVVPGNAFGLAGPHAGATVIDTDAYLDCPDGEWVIRVESATSPIDIEENLQGRTDCDGAAINAGNFCAVVDDIIDQDYVTYISANCNRMHEETHVDEWETVYAAEFDDLEDDLEALTVAMSAAVCSQAQAEAALAVQINALTMQAFADAVMAYQALGEAPAEAVETACNLAKATNLCNMFNDPDTCVHCP